MSATFLAPPEELIAMNVTNLPAELNSLIFLALDNHRVVRAACGEHGRWEVNNFLAEVLPVALAADPTDNNRVYAGTQGNGIYHSDDQGRSWAHLGLAGRIVKSLAVSPHDPRVIYAGVKPAAVFKTTDRGSHWTELDGFRRIPNRWWWFSPAEPPFQAYVDALTVSPTEPEVLLAGIELGAVVRSADGGRTWSRHLGGALRDCHSLKFHARNGQWVYEAGGTGGGAAVSRDGGRSWHKRKAGLVEHYGVTCAADPVLPEVWYIAVAPGPRQAYGDHATAYLYRGSAGSDWQPIGWEPHPMVDMPRSLITIPNAPGHLFAGTTKGDVWHTADYGDTWQKLSFNLGGGLSMLVL